MGEFVDAPLYGILEVERLSGVPETLRRLRPLEVPQHFFNADCGRKADGDQPQNPRQVERTNASSGSVRQHKCATAPSAIWLRTHLGAETTRGGRAGSACRSSAPGPACAAF